MDAEFVSMCDAQITHDLHHTFRRRRPAHSLRRISIWGSQWIHWPRESRVFLVTMYRAFDRQEGEERLLRLLKLEVVENIKLLEVANLDRETGFKNDDPY